MSRMKIIIFYIFWVKLVSGLLETSVYSSAQVCIIYVPDDVRYKHEDPGNIYIQIYPDIKNKDVKGDGYALPRATLIVLPS